MKLSIMFLKKGTKCLFFIPQNSESPCLTDRQLKQGHCQAAAPGQRSLPHITGTDTGEKTELVQCSNTGLDHPNET